MLGGPVQYSRYSGTIWFMVFCIYLKWFPFSSFDPCSLPPSSPLPQYPPLPPWHSLPSLSSTFLPRQRANQHTISLLTGKPDYQAIAVRSEYKPVQNMVNILPTTTSLEVCMYILFLCICIRHTHTMLWHLLPWTGIHVQLCSSETDIFTPLQSDSLKCVKVHPLILSHRVDGSWNVMMVSGWSP